MKLYCIRITGGYTIGTMVLCTTILQEMEEVSIAKDEDCIIIINKKNFHTDLASKCFTLSYHHHWCLAWLVCLFQVT
jgi:hypothetical protein